MIDFRFHLFDKPAHSFKLGIAVQRFQSRISQGLEEPWAARFVGGAQLGDGSVPVAQYRIGSGRE